MQYWNQEQADTTDFDVPYLVVMRLLMNLK